MTWELTTVAEDEVVAFRGTEVRRWTGLEPDTEHHLDVGLVARTLPRPPGERLSTIATVNDVHFGETECGILDGWADPVLRVEPGEPPYPETTNRAAADEIAARDPELVVAKGDLTSHGLPEEYGAFLDCYGRFGDRLLHVRGNHESHPGLHVADEPVQVRTVPGATVVLVDTSVDGEERGTLTAHQLGELDGLAAAADRPVLVFGHHPLEDLDPAAADALVALAARRRRVAGWFAGHTHRNRVRWHEGVPFAEVACVKDFPGAWAEYRVFEGGTLQVVHRIADPAALDWTERTRALFGGAYPAYAFGRLEDRCFALPSR